jgi:hypothetical protein
MVQLLKITSENEEKMEEDINFIPQDDKRVKAAKGKIARMRHLQQYKDLSDTDFDVAIKQKALGLDISAEFEKRIEKKFVEFDNDYDLSDLKINDKEALRALIQAIITLEDYEQHMYKLRAAGISSDSLYEVEKLQKAMSDLRSDISKLQNDLNITRKVRKSDQDVSVIAHIEGLKEKARKFYASKMAYIFCPKCNMLLGTFWVQYPENERNKIALICGRHLPDGKECGEKIIISTKDLLENRGTSKREITPDSML